MEEKSKCCRPAAGVGGVLHCPSLFSQQSERKGCVTVLQGDVAMPETNLLLPTERWKFRLERAFLL